MALFITFLATIFFVAVEYRMRQFEKPTDDEPRDSFPTTVIATMVWIAMLTPLFFSYG